MSSIPGQGAGIPYVLWPRKQNIKQKNIVTNLIKTLKIITQIEKNLYPKMPSLNLCHVPDIVLDAREPVLGKSEHGPCLHGPLFSNFVVQSLSCVWLVTPWTAACQASLSFTVSQSLLSSCPLSRWCHPSISPSVVPFFSCPQSFPASGSESCRDRWNKASSPWFQCLRSLLPSSGLHCLWGLDRPHFPSILEAPLINIFPIIPLLFWR